MTQTFKEKLQDLVNRAYLNGFNRGCDCDECKREKHISVEEAVKAIISAIEEIIPTAKKVSENHYDPCQSCGNLHQEPSGCEGFNECRKKILDRLKG